MRSIAPNVYLLGKRERLDNLELLVLLRIDHGIEP